MSEKINNKHYQRQDNNHKIENHNIMTTSTRIVSNFLSLVSSRKVWMMILVILSMSMNGMANLEINGSTSPSWINTSLSNIINNPNMGNIELDMEIPYYSRWETGQTDGDVLDWNITSSKNGLMVGGNDIYSSTQNKFIFNGSTAIKYADIYDTTNPLVISIDMDTTNTAAGNAILSKWWGVDSSYNILTAGDSKIRYYSNKNISGETYPTSNNAFLNTGNTNILIVYNYTNNTLYKNGVVDSVVNSQGIIVNGGYVLSLGAQTSDGSSFINYFTGNITRVLIHSLDPSAQQISQIANKSKYSSGNLTAWYDSGSGNEVHQIDVNATTPTNTNYTVWYTNNGTGSYSQLGGTLTGNNSLTISGTKYQNTDIQVRLAGNQTLTPELIQVTLFDQAAGEEEGCTSDCIPPTPISLTNTSGNFWVNYTWSAGSGNITNSYNISITNNSVQSWINGSSLTFLNSTLAANQWSNISVYAFNSSGTGSLNMTSISMNTQVSSEPIYDSNGGGINLTEHTNYYELNNSFYTVQINKSTGVIEHYRLKEATNDIALNDSILVIENATNNEYTKFTLNNIEIKWSTPIYKQIIINGTIGNDTTNIAYIHKYIEAFESPTIYRTDYLYPIQEITIDEYQSVLNFNGATDTQKYGGSNSSLVGNDSVYFDTDIRSDTMNTDFLREVYTPNGSIFGAMQSYNFYGRDDAYVAQWLFLDDDTSPNTYNNEQYDKVYYDYVYAFTPPRLKVFDNSTAKMVFSVKYNYSLNNGRRGMLHRSNSALLRPNKDYMHLNYAYSVNTNGNTMTIFRTNVTNVLQESALDGTRLWVGKGYVADFGASFLTDLEFDWHTTDLPSLYLTLNSDNENQEWRSFMLTHIYTTLDGINENTSDTNISVGWLIYKPIFNLGSEGAETAYPNAQVALDNIITFLKTDYMSNYPNETTSIINNLHNRTKLMFDDPDDNNWTEIYNIRMLVNGTSAKFYFEQNGVLNLITATETDTERAGRIQIGSYGVNQMVSNVTVTDVNGTLLFFDNFTTPTLDSSKWQSFFYVNLSNFTNVNGEGALNGGFWSLPATVSWTNYWVNYTLRFNQSMSNSNATAGYFWIASRVDNTLNGAMGDIANGTYVYLAENSANDAHMLSVTGNKGIETIPAGIKWRTARQNRFVYNSWADESSWFTKVSSAKGSVDSAILNMHTDLITYSTEMRFLSDSVGNTEYENYWKNVSKNLTKGYNYMTEIHDTNLIRNDGTIQYSRGVGAHDFYENKVINQYYKTYRYLNDRNLQNRWNNLIAWQNYNLRSNTNPFITQIGTVDTRATQYISNISTSIDAEAYSTFVINYSRVVRTNQTAIWNGKGGIYFVDNHTIINDEFVTLQDAPRLKNVSGVMVYDAWYNETDNKTKVIFDVVAPVNALGTGVKGSGDWNFTDEGLQVYWNGATWKYWIDDSQVNVFNMEDQGNPNGVWVRGTKYNRTTNHWDDGGNISLIPSSFTFDINSTIDTSLYPTMTIDLYNLKDSTEYTVMDNGTNTTLLTSNSTGFATYEQSLSNHSITITEGDYFTCGGLIHYSDSSYNWSICTNVNSTFTISSDKNLAATWSGSATVLFNTTIPEWASTTLYLKHDGTTVDTKASNVTGFVNFSYTGTNGTFNVSNVSAPNITSWQNNKTLNATSNFTLNLTESVNFNITANQTITTYNWYKDDVDQSVNFNNITISWSTSGLKTVKVNATSTDGTSPTIQWNVTVNIPTPTNLANYTPTSSSVDINWSSVTGATAYQVFKNTTSLGTTTNTYYNVTGLTTSTEYNFTVRANDSDGNYGANSSNLTVRTLADTSDTTETTTATGSGGSTGGGGSGWAIETLNNPTIQTIQPQNQESQILSSPTNNFIFYYKPKSPLTLKVYDISFKSECETVKLSVSNTGGIVSVDTSCKVTNPNIRFIIPNTQSPDSVYYKAYDLLWIKKTSVPTDMTADGLYLAVKVESGAGQYKFMEYNPLYEVQQIIDNPTIVIDIMKEMDKELYAELSKRIDFKWSY